MTVSRRRFLEGSACAAALMTCERVLGHASPASTGSRNEADAAAPAGKLEAFPPAFLFGAATSCVQIEGAAREDGKGESIWDRFSSKPGEIRDGSTPSVACDSYHLWPQDLALLRTMGLNSYRMSIAWPRIFPSGSGAVNQMGLDHYNRIIDALKEIGVSPLITCFHWDLPQALDDAGGWPNRDTAARFADYASLLAKTYGDRVQNWCLLNEPQAFTVAGYGWGVHAPGFKDRNLMLRAIHTSNLAQAAGFRAMKAERPSLKIGIAHDMVPFQPASSSDADRQACGRFDAFRNRWFLEPAFTGKYPEAFPGGNPYELMGFRPGDESLLYAPLDYSGINYYNGLGIVAAGDGPDILRGLDAHEVHERDVEFYSSGMKEVLLDFKARYKRPIVITETGCEEKEELTPGVPAHDTARISYLNRVLKSVLEAIAAGADVRGIHVWSLIDDWEWQDGFQARIGLAQVDFKKPGKRTLKDSGAWYGQVARSRTLPASA
jgi:beta-glucosidase